MPLIRKISCVEESSKRCCGLPSFRVCVTTMTVRNICHGHDSVKCTSEVTVRCLHGVSVCPSLVASGQSNPSHASEPCQTLLTKNLAVPSSSSSTRMRMRRDDEEKSKRKNIRNRQTKPRGSKTDDETYRARSAVEERPVRLLLLCCIERVVRRSLVGRIRTASVRVCM